MFSDEFTGTELDPVKWQVPAGWKLQNVTINPADVWLDNGLVLNLSSPTSGGGIRSLFDLEPGMVAEARIMFPGDAAGPNHIYNFPAWWTAGVKYPASGEHDIAEGLGDPSGLKISYWDQTRTLKFSSRPAGDWGNAYHTFTLRRGTGSATVWYDGQLVADYPTSDDGGAQRLLLTLGASSSFPPMLGLSGQVRVDYVRAWAPLT